MVKVMNKIVIDFKCLDNPLDTLNSTFGFKTSSFKEFFDQLRDIEIPMIVELKNTQKLDKDLKGLVELFENIQQKNEYVYVIRGIK